jgi:hypothetical protein
MDGWSLKAIPVLKLVEMMALLFYFCFIRAQNNFTDNWVPESVATMVKWARVSEKKTGRFPTHLAPF